MMRGTETEKDVSPARIQVFLGLNVNQSGITFVIQTEDMSYYVLIPFPG